MRTFTKWLVIIIFCEILTCMPGYAQVMPSVGIGSFRKTVVGAAVVSRIEVLAPDKTDSFGRAINWLLNKVEAVWDQVMGTYPEPTERDYLRIYIDSVGMGSPEMAEHIKGYGLTTDGKTFHDAIFYPGKGWAVDYKPGELKPGSYRFQLYVIHDNDLSGITIGPFVFQGHTEGQLSSATGLLVRSVDERAPYDAFPSAARQKMRSGFRSVDAASTLSEADRKLYDEACAEVARQRAMAEAESHRQQMIAEGGFCSTCLTITSQYVRHEDGVCPRLHPSSGHDLPFVEAPQTLSAPPVITSAAPSAPKPVVINSRPAAPPAKPMTIHFIYQNRPVQGSVTIASRDRTQPDFLLTAPGANRMRYSIQYPSGRTWSSQVITELPRAFNFSNFTPGCYQLRAEVQGSDGRWVTDLINISIQ